MNTDLFSSQTVFFLRKQSLFGTQQARDKGRGPREGGGGLAGEMRSPAARFGTNITASERQTHVMDGSPDYCIHNSNFGNLYTSLFLGLRKEDEVKQNIVKASTSHCSNKGKQKLTLNKIRLIL